VICVCVCICAAHEMHLYLAGCSVLQCVAVCCSVLQCVAECCSVLQSVAVCCSVLCVYVQHTQCDHTSRDRVMYVIRDLLIGQKRPMNVSKYTHECVIRDLFISQKRRRNVSYLAGCRAVNIHLGHHFELDFLCAIY